MNFIEKLQIKVYCTQLREAQIVPPKHLSGLNKLREELPQFKSIKDVDSFADFCKSTGTRVFKKSFRAHELNPSQSHIDSDKVIDIVQNYTQSNPPVMDPIVIDKDGYIIDGHHRWTAMMYMNPNAEIPVYQFNVKINRLIGNKVPRWQDTIGDNKITEGFEDDITDIDQVFLRITEDVLAKTAKVSGLFAKRMGPKVVVSDKKGNEFIRLQKMKEVILSVIFPGDSSVGAVNTFNHWSPEYAPRILKTFNTLISELKDYQSSELSDEDKKNIAEVKQWYKKQMEMF